jgi:hypothetical protein
MMSGRTQLGHQTVGFKCLLDRAPSPAFATRRSLSVKRIHVHNTFALSKKANATVSALVNDKLQLIDMRNVNNQTSVGKP